MSDNDTNNANGKDANGSDRNDSRNDSRNDRFYTATEVADMLKVSNMTVYRLIRSGELQAVIVGKNYRIRNADLEEYFASNVTRKH